MFCAFQFQVRHWQTHLNRDKKKYLEVVVHPRTHKLPEGIVCPLSDPAVDRHALCPEANGLRLKFTLLQGNRWRWEKWQTDTAVKKKKKNINRCRLLTPTSTALRTSLKTDRCFLLSVLALCLLQSVASVFSLSQSSSQSWNSKSYKTEMEMLHLWPKKRKKNTMEMCRARTGVIKCYVRLKNKTLAIQALVRDLHSPCLWLAQREGQWSPRQQFSC